MMNQYLCRNYVAEEVASYMMILPRVSRRMGHQNSVENNSTPPSHIFAVNQKEMLLDEGSLAYQDWLYK